jgi:hypothetical protein
MFLSRFTQLGRSARTQAGNCPHLLARPIRFFRKRGSVSFFDYRSASHKQIEDAMSPFNLPAADPESVDEPKIAFLFLSSTAYDRLIPWTKWEEEQSYSDKIVPYVEAGYLGSVPIASIEEVSLRDDRFPSGRYSSNAATCAIPASPPFRGWHNMMTVLTSFMPGYPGR